MPLQEKHGEEEVQGVTLKKATAVMMMVAAAGTLGYTAGAQQSGAPPAPTNLQKKYGLESNENGFGLLKGTRAGRKVDHATPKQKNGPEVHTLTKSIGKDSGYHFGTKAPKARTSHPERTVFDERSYKKVATHGPRITGAPRNEKFGTRAPRAFAEANEDNQVNRKFRQGVHIDRPATQVRAVNDHVRVSKSFGEDQRDAKRTDINTSPTKEGKSLNTSRSPSPKDGKSRSLSPTDGKSGKSRSRSPTKHGKSRSVSPTKDGKSR